VEERHVPAELPVHLLLLALDQRRPKAGVRQRPAQRSSALA